MRAGADVRDEKIGLKIREAELLRVPYMLVVGRREAETGMVAPRSRRAGQAEPRALDAMVEELLDEIRSKR